MARRARFLVPLAALGAMGCLPKDTRPAPSRLDVTVTADPVLAGDGGPLQTVDGWTIVYERVLVGVRASLDGDSCPSYYTEGYTRILDLGVPGSQHQSSLYSLGHCDVGFRIQSPSVDPYVPLGERVTPADHALLNVPAVDPYTKGRGGVLVPTGIALYVKGHATNGGVTKTFTWPFRQRISYQNCAAPHVARDAGPIDSGRAGSPEGGAVDAGDAALPFFTDAGSPGPRGVDLGAGVRTIDIRMHAEALFLDSTNVGAASPRFDVIARADDQYGNEDGDVTLDELALVPLPEVSYAGRYEDPPADTPGRGKSPPWTNLEDFVYLGLYPRVARYEGTGTCDALMAGGGGR